MNESKLPEVRYCVNIVILLGTYQANKYCKSKVIIKNKKEIQKTGRQTKKNTKCKGIKQTNTIKKYTSNIQ